MQFRDREQAGEELARLLEDDWKQSAPVVLALPRGGLPVAYPVARRLNAPMDILLVRKLGAPSNPEFALGAVTEDGKSWMNREAIRYLAPRAEELDLIAAQAVHEMQRQDARFREGRPAVSLQGRVVILVDDGLATGATMLAAIESAKARGAEQVVVAVPVASHEAARLVREQADRLQVAYEPDFFQAVGEWYESFDAVEDEEVIALLKAAQEIPSGRVLRQEVEIEVPEEVGIRLKGELSRPEQCRAWIVFAHGSGSSRKSPRNARVARALNEAGFGTLLFDLLTLDEAKQRDNVFDIDMLAYRLAKVTTWLRKRPELGGRPIGYFGASTGAAAALQACAEYDTGVYAVVSRGGRPDLAQDFLADVDVPVLLIVGGADHPVIELNLRASRALAHAKVESIPGASHLFEEPGTLEQVTDKAIAFFEQALETAERRAGAA